MLSLAEDDPLSARLLEAWVLQRLDRTPKTKKSIHPRDLAMSMLDEMLAKQWWNKERIDLALIQIAGRCQQRPLWSGVSELIELSGGNVLIFLSICQFIWDTQSQVGRRGESGNDLSEIETEVQAIGVFKASGLLVEEDCAGNGPQWRSFSIGAPDRKRVKPGTLCGSKDELPLATTGSRWPMTNLKDIPT